MAGMAVPLGCGGPATARRGKGHDAPSRRARCSVACSFLLADHGARRRHLGAERGLSAQHAAHPGQLCATLRPGRPIRPGGSGRGLLRGAGPHDQYYFERPEAMVSGIVRPPAIELANRDLVRAHLHAIWLAESGKELAPDIPHVLNLSDQTLPIQQEITQAFAEPDLKTRAGAAMKRVLDSIGAELTQEAAPWVPDREAFAAATADAAELEFSNAFDRWRQLYQGARDQLKEANRKSELPGLSANERKTAKDQQAQANEQLALLERGTSSSGSDFYTYRYLATEGFLPGYNFPRLPLYAYVPSIGAGPGGRAAYLQRARFVAIAEFGPGSLIYHEGRAFRVYRAKLPAGVRSEDGSRLSTNTIYICDE